MEFYLEKIYITSAFKLVSASCISRKLTFEELVENLTPDQISEKIVNFAFDLYADWKRNKRNLLLMKKNKEK